MLHLAQVQINEGVGRVELKLLARQHSENSWALINPENVPLTQADSLYQDLLVLVDLSETNEIVSIQPAKNWVLDLVQQYLTTGVTPKFLQEEAERTEQWRQDLTQRSQDLTRQRLEMEARREQIQTLEEDLKREKQQLEVTAAQLQRQEEDLKQEKERLEVTAAQLHRQEEDLKREKQHLDKMMAQLNSGKE